MPSKLLLQYFLLPLVNAYIWKENYDKVKWNLSKFQGIEIKYVILRLDYSLNKLFQSSN